MKCSTAQRRLSSQANPDRVPAGVQSHLDDCLTCRDWQRRVALLDQQVAAMPVPPTLAGASLLHRLRTEPPALRVLGRQAPNNRRWWYTTAGLAAAVLILAIGWRFLPTGVDNLPVRPSDNYAAAPDPLLGSLVQYNLTLARADSTRKQVETLADLADDLSKEALTLARAADVKDLNDLAGWYDLVLQVEVRRAGKLPADQRREVLSESVVGESVVSRLSKAGDAAGILAIEMQASSAAHPLHRIASAARDAKVKLQTLAGVSLAPRADDGRFAGVHTPGAGRRLLFAMPLAASPVNAAPAKPAPDAAGIHRFGRNRQLIEALVQGSIRLAEADDPLDRAASCQEVARSLAAAIGEAAKIKEGARVEELGKHFSDLLQRGIANNLVAARASAKAGSEREKKLDQLQTEVVSIAKPLEAQLKAPGASEGNEHLRRTLRIISDSRSEVENAFKNVNVLKETDRPDDN